MFLHSAPAANAHVAQLVEHVLGKDEVISSILIMGSSELADQARTIQIQEVKRKRYG